MAGSTYFCNTQVAYQLRGVHIKLDVLWGYEAEPGAGDTHLAIFRGSKASVEVRQGKEEKYRPELYVIPSADAKVARPNLEKNIARLQAKIPGVGLREAGPAFQIVIPDVYRVGHERTSARSPNNSCAMLRKQDVLPAWERPNMVAKYWTTTGGVELAKQG